MEMQFKKSQFNFLTTNASKQPLLYNTYTNKLVKFVNHDKKTIERILNGDSNLDSELFAKLIENEYLIPSNTDEFAKICSRFNKFYNNPVLNIMIIPTHNCNCRCIYCYEDFKGETMSKEIQDNLILFVKERLKKCSELHISWFGGEPLLAMDVIRNLSTQLMELCKVEHKRYTSSITTNGTLLTLDVFKELQKYRVISYQITIDGIKDIHDVQRPLANGNSSYDLIIQNLSNIKNSVNGKTFVIALRVNITKPIVEHIEEYIKDMDCLFGNDSRFQLMINIANDWGGERVASYRNELLSIEQNHDTFNKLHYILKQTPNNLNIYGIGASYMQELSFHPGCYVCNKNYLTIDSTGKITKCAQEIRYETPPLGDISQKPFQFNEEIEFAKWEYITFPFIHQKCKTCFLLPIGCCGTKKCLVLRYKEKYIEKLAPVEPECPITKNSIDILLKKMDSDKQAIILD